MHDTISRWQRGLIQTQTFSYRDKLMNAKAVHNQSQDYCLRFLDDLSLLIQTYLISSPSIINQNKIRLDLTHPLSPLPRSVEFSRCSSDVGAA